MKKVMIIEDDNLIRSNVGMMLRASDYDVVEAPNGEEALESFSGDIDIVLLDVMMPGMDGFEVCRRIRELSNVPILFLTAKTEETDKISGLAAGGDDYLVKPFSYNELLARISALLRRRNIYDAPVGENGSKNEWIEVDGLRIHRERNAVYRGEEVVSLTGTEYEILNLLANNPGKIFSNESIYESIWGESSDLLAKNSVMVHIRRLRCKIEEDPKAPRFVLTVWGKGYKFVERW